MGVDVDKTNRLSALNIVFRSFGKMVDTVYVDSPFFDKDGQYIPCGKSKFEINFFFNLLDPKSKNEKSERGSGIKKRYITGSLPFPERILENYREIPGALDHAGDNLFILTKSLNSESKLKLAEGIVHELKINDYLDVESRRTLKTCLNNREYRQFYINLLSFIFFQKSPENYGIKIQNRMAGNLKNSEIEEYLKFVFQYGLTENSSVNWLYRKVEIEKSTNSILMYELANHYYQGVYFREQNLDRAFLLYQESADRGFKLAFWALGEMYQQYKLPKSVLEKTTIISRVMLEKEYYEKAGSLCIQAMNSLGKLYLRAIWHTYNINHPNERIEDSFSSVGNKSLDTIHHACKRDDYFMKLCKTCNNISTPKDLHDAEEKILEDYIRVSYGEDLSQPDYYVFAANTEARVNESRHKRTGENIFKERALEIYRATANTGDSWSANWFAFKNEPQPDLDWNDGDIVAILENSIVAYKNSALHFPSLEPNYHAYYNLARIAILLSIKGITVNELSQYSCDQVLKWMLLVIGHDQFSKISSELKRGLTACGYVFQYMFFEPIIHQNLSQINDLFSILEKRSMDLNYKFDEEINFAELWRTKVTNLINRI